MNRAELADKIERQLGDKDTIFLRAAEWSAVLEALRAPRHVFAFPDSKVETDTSELPNGEQK